MVSKCKIISAENVLGKENIFRYLVAFQKLVGKYFHVFVFVLENALQNTFSIYFSYFLSFQTHIIIKIPIYKPKEQKKKKKTKQNKMKISISQTQH